MTRLVLFELFVTNLLMFDHKKTQSKTKTARWLTVFWTLWRNSIRQWLKEGCGKPVALHSHHFLATAWLLLENVPVVKRSDISCEKRTKFPLQSDTKFSQETDQSFPL